MGQVTLITGGERRRHWSDGDRARILAAIEEPGAVVAEVARREDVSTSLVYRWRREARQAGSAPKFTPLVIADAKPKSALVPAAGELEFGVIVVEVHDARVRIGSNAPAALVAATLKALRP